MNISKRKPGRPRKDGSRDLIRSIRFSQEEWNLIESAALEVDRDTSVFVRTCAVYQARKMLEKTEKKKRMET